MKRNHQCNCTTCRRQREYAKQAQWYRDNGADRATAAKIVRIKRENKKGGIA